jgi:hypothetical protein
MAGGISTSGLWLWESNTRAEDARLFANRHTVDALHKRKRRVHGATEPQQETGAPLSLAEPKERLRHVRAQALSAAAMRKQAQLLAALDADDTTAVGGNRRQKLKFAHEMRQLAQRLDRVHAAASTDDSYTLAATSVEQQPEQESPMKTVSAKKKKKTNRRRSKRAATANDSTVVVDAGASLLRIDGAALDSALASVERERVRLLSDIADATADATAVATADATADTTADADADANASPVISAATAASASTLNSTAEFIVQVPTATTTGRKTATPTRTKTTTTKTTTTTTTKKTASTKTSTKTRGKKKEWKRGTTKQTKDSRSFAASAALIDARLDKALAGVDDERRLVLQELDALQAQQTRMTRRIVQRAGKAPQAMVHVVNVQSPEVDRSLQKRAFTKKKKKSKKGRPARHIPAEVVAEWAVRRQRQRRHDAEHVEDGQYRRSGGISDGGAVAIGEAEVRVERRIHRHVQTYESDDDGDTVDVDGDNNSARNVMIDADADGVAIAGEIVDETPLEAHAPVERWLLNKAGMREELRRRDARHSRDSNARLFARQAKHLANVDFDVAVAAPVAAADRHAASPSLRRQVIAVIEPPHRSHLHPLAGYVDDSSHAYPSTKAHPYFAVIGSGCNDVFDDDDDDDDGDAPYGGVNANGGRRGVFAGGRGGGGGGASAIVIPHARRSSNGDGAALESGAARMRRRRKAPVPVTSKCAHAHRPPVVVDDVDSNGHKSDMMHGSADGDDSDVSESDDDDDVYDSCDANLAFSHYAEDEHYAGREFAHSHAAWAAQRQSENQYCHSRQRRQYCDSDWNENAALFVEDFDGADVAALLHSRVSTFGAPPRYHATALDGRGVNAASAFGVPIRRNLQPVHVRHNEAAQRPLS